MWERMHDGKFPRRVYDSMIIGVGRGRPSVTWENKGEKRGKNA